MNSEASRASSPRPRTEPFAKPAAIHIYGREEALASRQEAMHASHAVIVAAVVGSLAILGTGCNDSTAPPNGTIQVTVTSTGNDIDPDGYTVTVDSRLSTHVAASNTIAFAGLATGDHSVRLDNLASNCTVTGANPRTVSVVAEATATASFAIACVARTGIVRVTIRTTGVPLDPDGYRLSVDGGSPQLVPANGDVTLADIREGGHTLTLSDVASHCVVGGTSQNNVTVLFAGTTQSQFSIVCTGKGTLKITSTTTGVDVDADGYFVNVYSATDYYGPSYGASVSANGSVSIPDIVAGVYGLSLGGLASNCKLSGTNPNEIVIEHQATTSATVNVVCAGKGTLRITSTTTGVDPDPDGYSVHLYSKPDNYGNSYSAGVPVNGSVSVTNIVAGAYTLVVDGWAANCELSGASPRDIVIGEQVTTETAVNVVCEAVRRLAFVLTNAGLTDVYAINSNGTGFTRLTTRGASNEDPAWSPDGSKIAFATNRDGSSRIYVMNADGSNQRALTPDGVIARQPTWSPDGEKIAFVGSAGGDSEIYVMKADGTNVVRLTVSTGLDIDPAWSPNGERIAFRSDRSGNGDIYVMNVDGSNASRLTTATEQEKEPAWSPDGTKIVFARGQCDWYYGCYFDLVVMNANGSGASRLNIGPSSTAPAWSSDGRWIAFAAEQCDYYECANQLRMVKPDGTGGGVIFEGNGSQPAWRP
jgi:WD40 repeat protein